MNIYDIRRRGTAIFLLISVGVVAFFLFVSNRLVDDLAEQERSRMQIWADATRQIVCGDGSDIDFLLSIIEDNQTIPVVLTDENGSVLSFRNMEVPPHDRLAPYLDHLRDKGRMIIIELGDSRQFLYYDESNLLRRLSYYPYIQLCVMIIFVIVVYLAVTIVRRAEQNKVWVGMSKETAHQLGTPISSLQAWNELLTDYGVPSGVTGEMQKDIARLASVASRFGKIGSKPAMEPGDVNEVTGRIAGYMAGRISGKIVLNFSPGKEIPPVYMSAPLLEWVMENLIKNAADAIDEEGRIDISTAQDPEINSVRIIVTDTGKGMSRATMKNIFHPGFSTKQRGWGLGLTLAKRIVEEYHSGQLSVTSKPGEGTTFTITIPLS